MSDVSVRIQALLKAHDVVLFMKGTKNFPQCGFSNTVVEILKREEVPFETHNVLADPELREGVKAYAQWPTLPQLYIKGEFVGGCDIVTELHTRGDLDQLLRTARIKPSTSA